MLNTKIRGTLSAAGIWYHHFERPISSISLIGGFVFDALTLKRLDMFWENFWVVVHLVVVGICIILVNMPKGGESAGGRAQRHFWYVNILQFFFGGLLSTYLVFYFRSATLAVSWPFLLILLAAFVANEQLKAHYERLTFQIGLFYLSIFLFAIYIVPIIVHRIGPFIFLLSGFVSLILLGAFVSALRRFARDEYALAAQGLFLSISLMFLAINLLYYFNVIPPIPLSLRDAGIYHSIARQADGNYLVQGENQGISRFVKFHEDIHLMPGSPVYAYSAVFSPTALRTNIVHQWQRYDYRSRRWVTESTVDLAVGGGRDGGYRTYSIKSGIVQGLWRVNVETPRGQVLGRLRFWVTVSDAVVGQEAAVKN